MLFWVRSHSMSGSFVCVWFANGTKAFDEYSVQCHMIITFVHLVKLLIQDELIFTFWKTFCTH